MPKLIANYTTAQMVRKIKYENKSALSIVLGMKVSNKTLRS